MSAAVAIYKRIQKSNPAATERTTCSCRNTKTEQQHPGSSSASSTT